MANNSDMHVMKEIVENQIYPCELANIFRLPFIKFILNLIVLIIFNKYINIYCVLIKIT